MIVIRYTVSELAPGQRHPVIVFLIRDGKNSKPSKNELNQNPGFVKGLNPKVKIVQESKQTASCKETNRT